MESDQDDFGRTWDGVTCPNLGCDGELQQQDRFNVACMECDDAWSHVTNGDDHWLQASSGHVPARMETGETPVVHYG